MPVPPNRTDTFAPRSLADAIARGPLAVPIVLRIAYDLAVELRDLHEQTRAYGKLTPHAIVFTETGARLMPQRAYWDQALPERDVQAFGDVLYQMLHGHPPASIFKPEDIKISASHSGEAKLIATCTRLALRCVNQRGARMTMQQVTTELRLLGVIQRQEGAGPRTTPEEAPPAPPAYKAPPTWTPPIEMLIDSPGAVPLPPPAPLADGQEGPPAPLAQERESVPPVIQLGPASFGQPKPKPPSVEEPRGGKCPRCDAPVVYESRARSKFELLVERMKLPLVRCHRCYHRYVVVGRLKIPKDMPVGSARRFGPQKRA